MDWGRLLVWAGLYDSAIYGTPELRGQAMTREVETVEEIALAINGNTIATEVSHRKGTAALSVIRKIVFEEVEKQVTEPIRISDFGRSFATNHRSRAAAEIKAALIERLGSG